MLYTLAMKAVVTQYRLRVHVMSCMLALLRRLKPGTPAEKVDGNNDKAIAALAALGIVASSIGAWVVLRGWPGGL